ncbi:MAG: hypothetical protein IBX43_09205 [Campylobacterales bacterium]|nr:hypothetical protein [Campylobacterales bacterium]
MRKVLSTFALILAMGFSGCSTQSLSAGEEAAPKEAHAYLIGAMMSAEEVSAKLGTAGFEVLGSFEVNPKEKLQTVIYTNETMKAMANKPGRGFAAIGRVLVDAGRNKISVSNPVYFGKAFMQNEADYAALNAIKERLNSALGSLNETSDKWEYAALADYHFMVGMPYYQDSVVIGEGDSEELMKKAQTYKKGALHLFTLKIAEGKYLVGYDLDKRTAKFPEKIGTHNSGLLPYTVLIENNEARILAPKFYLAVSYPQLTMGEFMKIATVPGAIEKDLSRAFK